MSETRSVYLPTQGRRAEVIDRGERFTVTMANAERCGALLGVSLPAGAFGAWQICPSSELEAGDEP